MINVEDATWTVIPQVMGDTSAKRIKQLILIIHVKHLMDELIATPELFIEHHDILDSLTRNGFEKWKITACPLSRLVSPTTGKKRDWCFNVFYVNRAFL